MQARVVAASQANVWVRWSRRGGGKKKKKIKKQKRPLFFSLSLVLSRLLSDFFFQHTKKKDRGGDPWDAKQTNSACAQRRDRRREREQTAGEWKLEKRRESTVDQPGSHALFSISSFNGEQQRLLRVTCLLLLPFPAAVAAAAAAATAGGCTKTMRHMRQHYRFGRRRIVGRSLGRSHTNISISLHCVCVCICVLAAATLSSNLTDGRTLANESSFF